MIRGHDEIRDAYQSPDVAKGYIEERFRQPLGALLHHRQASFLRRLIGQDRPQRILEIAPGPARLTVEVARSWSGRLVVMDASAAMLVEARTRLPTGTARFIRSDAFQLPFKPEFDLVYTFRFIRHFEAADRASLYEQIVRVMRPGGLLVFDAVNEAVSGPIRGAARPDEYQHYDALLRPETLRADVKRSGLQLISLHGVQHRYPMLSRLQVLVAPRSRVLARGAMEVIERLGGEPLEWIAVCRRA